MARGSRFILSADLGTTSLRCHIYDDNAKLQGKSQIDMDVLYPRQGWCEIDPEMLWDRFSYVCQNAVKGNFLT